MKIVYIEDDEADFLALKRILKPIQKKIELNWIDNLNSLKNFKEKSEFPDLILLDYQFPGSNAIELIHYFRGISSDIEIAMLTAYQEKSFKHAITKHGIEKIFNKNKLQEVYEFILEKNNTKNSHSLWVEKSTDFFESVDENINNRERRLMVGAFLSIPEPIVFLDANFNIFFKNPAFDRLAENEFSRKDVTFIELINSDATRIKDAIEFTKSGQSEAIFLQFENKYGGFLSVEISCSFIPKEDGFYCLIFKNYSRIESFNETLKTIEYYQKIIPSYIFNELALNANPQILFNHHFQVLGFNENAKLLINNNLKIGVNLLKILAPQNANLISNNIQNCITEPISLTCNFNRIIYDLYINPIIRNAQEKIYSISFIEYNTNPQANNLYINPIKNYKLLIDNSDSIIFQLNNKGEIIYISESYETITGFTKQEVLNKPLGINQGDEIQKIVKTTFAKLASKEITEGAGFATTKTKENKILHLRYRVESILDVFGNFIGLSGVFTDVTESFQTLKALEKTEKSLNQIVSNIIELIFVIDHEHNITYVTPSCLAIIGYKTDELLKKNYITFIHPDDLKTLNNFIANYPSENKNSEGNNIITIRFKKKNGDYTNLETLIKKVEGTNGENTNYIGTSRSVDEKIASDFKLKETKRLLEIVTDIQKLYIETKDIGKTFGILLNHILRKTKSDFGFICEVLMDENGNPYMRSNALTNIAWDQASHEFYAKNSSKGVEFRNLNTLFGRVLLEKKLYLSNDAVNDPFSGGTPPGHPIIKSFVGIPIFKNNEMLAVLGLANNPNGYSQELIDKIEPLLLNIGSIIEQNKIEVEITKTQKELAKSEAQVKAILTSIEDIVFEINSEFEIINVWAKDPDKLAIPKHHYLNKNFASLIEPYPFTSKIYEILLEVAKDGIERFFEYNLFKNETPIWNKARIFVLTNDPHKTFCLQISDITVSKNAEENLRLNLIQEKELAELKTRFVTLTSHEFRTPLTSISSSNELISMHLKKLKIPISDKLEKYLQIIQSEVRHMSNLLNDVLILGKMDSKKMEINLNHLNIMEAVGEIMENLFFTSKIPRKIETRIIGKPYEIKMDIKVLEHILENIFNNAFKYSPDRPDPILEIDFQSSKIVLALQDFGIGIPILDQPKLFEQFYRARNVGKIHGVGLGLVIVKNMVEMLQGNLRIESEEGKGTKIEIAFNKENLE
jgi:PAS domain S-box-containing protein